jgi:hypothetical protein
MRVYWKKRMVSGLEEVNRLLFSLFSHSTVTVLVPFLFFVISVLCSF